VLELLPSLTLPYFCRPAPVTCHQKRKTSLEWDRIAAEEYRQETTATTAKEIHADSSPKIYCLQSCRSSDGDTTHMVALHCPSGHYH
jgi:hypothetical protein